MLYLTSCAFISRLLWKSTPFFRRNVTDLKSSATSQLSARRG